jgi:hypothetical protein
LKFYFCFIRERNAWWFIFQNKNNNKARILINNKREKEKNLSLRSMNKKLIFVYFSLRCLDLSQKNVNSTKFNKRAFEYNRRKTTQKKPVYNLNKIKCS